MAPKGAVLLVVLKNQCGPSHHLPGFSTISWGGPSCTSLVICCGPSCHFPRFSTISWGEDLVQALWFCWSVFLTCVLVEVQFLGYRFGLKGSTYTRQKTVCLTSPPDSLLNFIKFWHFHFLIIFQQHLVKSVFIIYSKTVYMYQSW